MQRFAQYIFTSCGWFFDEISGIETVQIIQYAVRTIQLAEELSGQFFEEEFIRLLKRAPSNVLGDGGQVYEEYAKPAKVDMLRVGAHFAMSSVFHESMDAEEFSCFSVSADTYNRLEAGRSGSLREKAASPPTSHGLSSTFNSPCCGRETIT